MSLTTTLRLAMLTLAFSPLMACSDNSGGGSNGTSPAPTAPAPTPTPATPAPATPAPVSQPVASGQPLRVVDASGLIQRYCTGCHSGTRAPAQVRLDSTAAVHAVARSSSSELQSGRMPPSDDSQPSATEKAQMIAWLQSLATSP